MTPTGETLLRQGKAEEALPLLQQAWQRNPDSLSQRASLAAALQELGRLSEAEAHYRVILQVNPQHSLTLCNLGAILAQTQRLEEAIACLTQATQVEPNDAALWCNLGATLRKANRLHPARECQERALGLNPHLAQAHLNLGNVLYAQGDLQGALQAYQRAAEQDNVEAKVQVGQALHQAGQPLPAEKIFRAVLQHLPQHPRARTALAELLLEQRRTSEALTEATQPVQSHPELPEGHHVLGNVQSSLGQLDAAMSSYEKALKLQPDRVSARYNRAKTILAQGRIQEAQEEFQGVLWQDPHDSFAHDTYLASLLYDPEVGEERLAAEHEQWAQWHLKKIQPQASHERDLDPNRPLRVGYVSPDYRSHPVAAFLEPILSHHNREQVHVFAYSDVKAPDESTRRLQGYVDRWHDVQALSDEALAQLIETDKIDVLVDLAGHTSGHRLLVFARKPAPLQVTYLGYPCTTGLSSIDARLVDAVTVPEDAPSHGTEEIIRLPVPFCCYRPPYSTPIAHELPQKKSGIVTFGSLHKLEKINEQVLDLWCEVIRAIPNSRLLLCRNTLQGETAKRMARQLRDRGLTSKQFLLRWVEPIWGQHLHLYAQMDVALDTFPWSGHTTACEALRMGVPVLTLPGNHHASRMVSSILTSMGLTDWIADSKDDLLRIAQQKAQDVEQLARLRTELRERMQKSPLTDGATFTAHLEKVFRQLWQRWVKQQDQSSRK